MPLPSLNVTQEFQVLEAFFELTASSVAPLLLLESLVAGILCACVPLISYMLWIHPTSAVPRVPCTVTLWIFFVAAIIHWALSLRQLETSLTGRFLGISLSFEDLLGVANEDQSEIGILVGRSFVSYIEAWAYLLPLVEESMLFGFASVLFAITAYTTFRQHRSQRRSCFALAVPLIACLMYAASLIHWVILLRSFAMYTNAARAPAGNFGTNAVLDLVLSTLLSFNAVFSDSIVLWRMSIVLNRARTVLAFCVVLFVTTLGLNIANVVVNAGDFLGGDHSGVIRNARDSERNISVYGSNSIGLAAAFVSLASNFCATMLVGVKAWWHRKLFTRDLRFDNGRTFVDRVLALLMDSGIIYTAIWLLYCISFFRSITTPATNAITVVPAISHLDAAMAQVTTIYPLVVFILVALDKLHHSRTPEWSKGRVRPVAVTVTLDTEVELSTLPSIEAPRSTKKSPRYDTSNSDAGIEDKTIRVDGHLP